MNTPELNTTDALPDTDCFRNPDPQERWKSHIRITYEDSYTEHGCHMYGPLAIVHCMRAHKNHPGWGQFGSMSCYDVSDEAEIRIKVRHPEAVRLLSIPDVVMRIDQTEWNKRQTMPNFQLNDRVERTTDARMGKPCWILKKGIKGTVVKVTATGIIQIVELDGGNDDQNNEQYVCCQEGWKKIS